MKKLLVIFLICISLPCYADYYAQVKQFEQQRQRYYDRQQAYQNRVLQNREYKHQQQEEIRTRSLGLFENQKQRACGYTGVHYYDY